MKVLYIINTQKYNYHRRLLEDFCKIVPGDFVDMSEEGPLHEKYKQISSYAPDVFVTFDTAGFELRTSNDKLTLNALTGRGANILFRKIDSYGRDVKLRQNLSMFMYINANDDLEKAIKDCTDVPNILRMSAIDYNATSEMERKSNQTAIASWWDDFKKEAML